MADQDPVVTITQQFTRKGQGESRPISGETGYGVALIPRILIDGRWGVVQRKHPASDPQSVTSVEHGFVEALNSAVREHLRENEQYLLDRG